MLLSTIAAELGASLTGADPKITRIDYDSRRVEPGSLFCCCRGAAADGHAFAAQAVEKGASALIVEHALPLSAPQLVVPDARRAMAEAAACFYGHPERALTLIGVTGTNGKTSTTYMVKSIAEAAGKKVGLIGTIHNLIGDAIVETNRTTPESVDLYALLRRMVDEGVDLAVMEVSSHALVQERVHGLMFDAALFTNLTQDHLDYHKTFDNYLAAKKLLFTDMARTGIFNTDDPYAARMMEGVPCKVRTAGIHSDADYRASRIEITTRGVSFLLHTPSGQGTLSLRISGLFTVYNAMGAVALMEEAGFSFADCKRGLSQLTGVAGRLQPCETFDRNIAVYVDYAHTPDALLNVLTTVQGFRQGRVITLFGCGGDRDALKRPIMGEIAGQHSDFVVVTSDNPRTEDSMSIIRAIEPGVKKTGAAYAVIENRRDAIRFALDQAGAHDIIVIAGKGHENYQEICGVKHHFDDKEEVETYLREGR